MPKSISLLADSELVLPMPALRNKQGDPSLIAWVTGRRIHRIRRTVPRALRRCSQHLDSKRIQSSTRLPNAIVTGADSQIKAAIADGLDPVFILQRDRLPFTRGDLILLALSVLCLRSVELVEANEWVFARATSEVFEFHYRTLFHGKCKKHIIAVAFSPRP